MSEALFPVVDVPEFAPENSEYDREYRRSVKWNPAEGDFVKDGANRMVECSGREAFAIWCYKIAQTERYQCLAYSNDIGTEMERAMSYDDEKTVESMVARTIEDAIMVNPRTEWVRDFEFSWNGDNMTCTFRVKGIDWEDIITITI